MPIRLLIAAEPSLTRDLVAALPQSEFVVESIVSDPGHLLTRCRELRPQLVLLQNALARQDRLTCVKDVMAFAPTPILMVARPEEETAHTFDALAFGALDAVVFHEGNGAELVHRAHLLAGVRVITHIRARRERPRPTGASSVGRLIAIGASLGGPRALAQLLRDLKAPPAAPLLIVQHISDGFTEGLAHWLSSESNLDVRMAEDGESLVPGLIALAPFGQHLIVADGHVRLIDDPPEGGFRPSCTTLFRSVARHHGSRAIGVVLTGMGSDGAAGLLDMRRAGARTLAQDEATCIVFGMPRAAEEAGAVEQILPLDQMARTILRLLED